MDGGGIGWQQGGEFAKAVDHRPAIKGRGQFASIGINVIDVANVAVLDLLVVVVLDLHDLVAWRKCPAKPLDLAITGGVQRGLELNVERPRTGAATIHWAEHLDISNGVEAKALGNSRLDQFNDALDGGLGFLG